MKQLDRIYYGYFDIMSVSNEHCIFVPLKYPKSEVIKRAKKFFLELQQEDRERYNKLHKEMPDIYPESYWEYSKNTPRFHRRGKLEKGYVSNGDICVRLMQGKRSYQKKYKCWIIRLKDKEELC